MKRKPDKTLLSGPHVAPHDFAVVPGSVIDVTEYYGISYTVVCQNKAVRWSVWGADQADWSDEECVTRPELIAPGQASGYSRHPAPMRFYRIKAQSADGAGAITVHGVARA
jgi:hypothetical protein